MMRTRHFFILTLLLVCASTIAAQNVGISDDNATPEANAMLELRRANHVRLRLAAKNFSDTSSICFSNRTDGNSTLSGTDFLLTSVKETGLFFHSVSDLSQNTRSNILVLKPNGRIGVGLSNPTYLFHVAGLDNARTGFFENAYEGASTKYGLYATATDAGTGARYGVWGGATANGSTAETFGLYGAASGTGTGNQYGVYGTAGGATGYGLYGLSNAANGYGVYGSANGAASYGVYGSNINSGGYAGYFAGRAKVDGDLILGANAAVFDLNGYQSALEIELFDNSAVKTIELRARDNSGETGGEINLYGAGGRSIEIDGNFGGDNAGRINLYAGADQTILIDGNWEGSSKGRIVTDELQITGGSDLAEKFDIAPSTGPDMIPQPGHLLSIAPDGSGRLNLTSKAHDRGVAGVVSGAGGIQTGMLMGQTGRSDADGQYAVALVGRVYVWADAAYGPIRPGDLLASSDTPGHAMSLGDAEAPRGAVIGKAMTALANGRGLVLMLISLQ